MITAFFFSSFLFYFFFKKIIIFFLLGGLLFSSLVHLWAGRFWAVGLDAAVLISRWYRNFEWAEIFLIWRTVLRCVCIVFKSWGFWIYMPAEANYVYSFINWNCSMFSKHDLIIIMSFLGDVDLICRFGMYIWYKLSVNEPTVIAKSFCLVTRYILWEIFVQFACAINILFG